MAYLIHPGRKAVPRARATNHVSILDSQPVRITTTIAVAIIAISMAVQPLVLSAITLWPLVHDSPRLVRPINPYGSSRS